MTQPDPTLPSELVEALRSEPLAIDASARARIQTRLAVSTGLGLPAAHDSGIELVGSTATAAAAKTSATLLAIGFAVGAGVGAAGHAMLAPPAVQIVYRDRVVEVKAPAAAAPTTVAEAAATPAPLPQPVKAIARPSATMTAPADSASAAELDEGLSAELGLLDRARKALGSGDAGRALDALETHAERYPASRLEQEREALEVKALIAAGRHAEARESGKTFEQRYPKSMLLDSVKKALRSIP